jgi:hypothetical protein
MPARMKLWTNWRWNSRKAIRSGPEVISVAAVMTDQSTPWSVEEKMQFGGEYTYLSPFPSCFVARHEQAARGINQVCCP